MTAALLGSHEPNSPAWHELRANGLGASEIAAVVGLSPYESAFSLWHRKKGNLAGPAYTNAMDWGHRLEPLVRDWFQERHPEFVVIPTPGTYAHAERDWQRVNPDGLIGNSKSIEPVTALYEGKTSRYGDGFGKSGTDEIPLHYRCQVMQALDIFGLPRAYVAVLIGGNDPREYVIDYDAEDAKALREAGAAFWQSIQTDDEPPIDASHETYEAIRELHPDIDPDLDVPIPLETWLAYVETKEAAENAADAHRLAKSTVLRLMGNARRAIAGDTPVLRRQPSRSGVALYPIKESA